MFLKNIPRHSVLWGRTVSDIQHYSRRATARANLTYSTNTYLLSYVEIFFSQMAKTEVISWHISFTFSSDCAFTPGRVLEVYSYHHVDTLQGVTIRYEALQQSTNENVELEALIHIQRRYTIVQPLGPANRLIKLQVWNS